MCGNWGLLCIAEYADRAQRRGEAFPEGLQKLLQQMLQVIQLRGAQAGGIQYIASGSNGQILETCRARVLKPKRGDLSKTVFKRFNRSLWQQQLMRGRLLSACCVRPSRGIVLAQGHSRFGTSSVPAVMETHPHQWVPGGTSCTFWSFKDGAGWKREHTTCCITITHNGDFDAWRPYRETTIDVGTLGLWLDRVLCRRHLAAGDSPKVAGVMELLLCQGVWSRAVRFAYHLYVACHAEQACGWSELSPESPSTVPDSSDFNAWAAVFENQFEKMISMLQGTDDARYALDENGPQFEAFVESCAWILTSGSSSQRLKQWIPDGAVQRFAKATVEAFRDNDPLAATRAFFCHADGTFGLSVSCTLWPQRVVLAARGQPMSVGFGGDAAHGSPEVAVWSSEPKALGTAGDKTSDIHARYDMDDKNGEVMELSVVANPVAQPCRQETDQESPRQPVALEFCSESETEDFHFRVDLSVNGKIEKTASDQNRQSCLMICGMMVTDDVGDGSFSPEWMLSSEQFHSKLLMLHGPVSDKLAAKDDLAGAPPEEDSVQQDLWKIPDLIRDIDTCWSDGSSLNSRSAKHFADMLFQTARSADPTGQQVHLIVFGIENSLWLAQQFCADLTRIFPTLKAIAMSSNLVMGLLQGGPGHVDPQNWIYSRNNFLIGPDTIGLAVSHSGTTYPTVWAARHLCSKTERVFALSSSFDCLLAGSIGQAPMQPFKERLFSSLAGLQPVEASTAATVALQHTLSYLMLRCAAHSTGAQIASLQVHTRKTIMERYSNVQGEQRNDEAYRISGNHILRNCQATSADVEDMHRLLLTLYYGACRACGVSAQVADTGSDTYHELTQMGRTWSYHITEMYWATFVPAAYVLVTVTTGYPLVTSVGKLIASSCGEAEINEPLLWLLRGLDALIYVFLPVLVAMLHRLLTGRRVWARFTTRTLLIVESTMNYKLLRAYTSKLVSLSWRFATISVVGQNGADHFVHEYTHKAQSDVLLAVGLPDGRLPGLATAEANMLMSVQQAKFIKGQGRGIEPYVIGHNPWTRKGLFIREVKLPTTRLRFASEQILLRDKLMEGEGLAPGQVLQRWSDLTTLQQDPMGMPRIRLTLAEVREMIAPQETLDHATAERILRQLLERQAGEAQMEIIPLGLRRFLSTFIASEETVVRVHSPVKAYDLRSPSRIYSTYSTSSPDKSYAGPDAAKSKLETITTSWQRGVSGGSAVSAHDSARQTVMQPSEFMALVHGDELQKLVKSARFRWKKIVKVRGVLANLAEKQMASTAAKVVLAGGVTLGQVLISWRRLSKRYSMEALPEAPPDDMSPVSPGKKRKTSLRKASTTSVLAASLQEFDRNEALAPVSPKSMATTLTVVTDQAEGINRDGLGMKGDLVGQDFLNRGLEESDVLEKSRLTEAFYESRVGGVERLISWYVIFHAMAEPSSRLPFLGYDLGKTESMLRVASTPAPVPAHGNLISLGQSQLNEDDFCSDHDRMVARMSLLESEETFEL